MSNITAQKNFKLYVNKDNRSNYNLLEGLMPDKIKLVDVKEAMDTDDVVVMVDSLFHSNLDENIIKERYQNSKPIKILIDYAYETGLSEKDFDKKIVDVCKTGVAPSDILWALNRSANSKWMAKHEDKIALIDLFAISATIRHAIYLQPASNVKVSDRPLKANLLLGKVNKPSRKKIIESFFNHSLKQDTIFSFLDEIESDSTDLVNFVKSHQGPIDNAATEYTNEGISSQGWSTKTTVYDNSSVSFICETHETNPCYFLTEKTYRPILNRQPFVIRAAFDATKYLNKLGFMTFSKYINEEFTQDSEELVDRCHKLLGAVAKHPEEIEVIVNHNYTTLVELAKLDIARLNATIFNNID